MNFTAQLIEERLMAMAPAVRVANCAACGDLLVSERTRRRWPHDLRGVGDIHCHVKGRPVCRRCFADGGLSALLTLKEPTPCTTSGATTTGAGGGGAGPTAGAC